MKKCCLLCAVLLFPLLAMADYELDWPEEDIEEFHASCIQSALESTGRLDASGLAILRLPAFVMQKCWISSSAMKISWSIRMKS